MLKKMKLSLCGVLILARFSETKLLDQGFPQLTLSAGGLGNSN